MANNVAVLRIRVRIKYKEEYATRAYEYSIWITRNLEVMLTGGTEVSEVVIKVVVGIKDGECKMGGG